MKVKSYLDQNAHDACLKQDLISFFSNKHALLNDIVHEVSGGKYLTKVTQEVFKELGDCYKDPDRGIKAIIDLGIPIAKYREMAQFNQFADPETNTWKHKKINGVTIPNTWPSNTTVQQRWAALRNSFGIRSIDGEEYFAAAWRVDKWLDYVLSSPFYSNFIEDPDNIEIILRGDGFRAGKQDCTFWLATLGNFGMLSKCTVFNFVVNLAFLEEKDISNIRRAFE